MVYDLSFNSVAVVNESWEAIRKIPDYHAKAGEGLFRRFFEMDPEAASIFHFGQENLTDDNFYSSEKFLKHASFFINMIDRAVQLLGPDIDLLSDVLVELGKKHSEMGVKPSYFPVMGDALLKTLQDLLGESFDDAAKDAWCEVWQAMSYDMIRARDGVNETKAHPGRRASGNEEWICVED